MNKQIYWRIKGEGGAWHEAYDSAQGLLIYADELATYERIKQLQAENEEWEYASYYTNAPHTIDELHASRFALFPAEHVLDEGGNSFVLAPGHTGCWITLGRQQIHIVLDDDGVNVEVSNEPSGENQYEMYARWMPDEEDDE